MTPPAAGELEAHWQRARRCLGAGDMRAATAELEAIVALDPHQPMAWLTLARVAVAQQRCRAAIGHLRNATEAVRETGQWQLLADVALQLEGLGESLLAVRLIQAAGAEHPQVLAAADRLAQCLGRPMCTTTRCASSMPRWHGARRRRGCPTCARPPCAISAARPRPRSSTSVVCSLRRTPRWRC
jgi:hypothetical protein